MFEGFSGPLDLQSVRLVGSHQGRRSPALLHVGTSDAGRLDEDGLFLNHKAIGAADSVTEYVCRQSDEVIAEWKRELEKRAGAAGEFSIAVEDASPDTMLAIIALSVRFAGEEFPRPRREIADAWELGHVKETLEFDRAFGPLASAYAHDQIFRTTPCDPDGEPEPERNATGIDRSKFIDWLVLTHVLLDRGIDPLDIPDRIPGGNLRANAILRKSRALLASERRTYERLKANARTIQLAVHLSSGRKTIVDAIFFSERVLTGATKVFARTDRDTFCSEGFAFMGVHRAAPDLRGSGNDIVLSTDPDAGLSLRLLWRTLEDLEEQAWAEYGAERPRGPDTAANRMLGGYELEDTLLPCHQPWYHDTAFTLVAAPGMVVADGEPVPGSRLGWRDIKDAIWKCYAPTLGLRLRPRGTQESWQKFTDPESARRLRVPLGEGTSLRIVDVERQFLGEDDVHLWTPTLSMAMADFIRSGRSSIDTLPELSDFDVAERRGGITIVSESGVAIVDLGSAGEFPSDELRRVANEVANTLSLAESLETEIRSTIRPAAMKALERGAGVDRRRAMTHIYNIRLRARQEIDTSRRKENEGILQSFRDQCERRWQGIERLDRAMSEVDDLEKMILGFNGLKAGVMLNTLTLYGLPLSLSGNFLGALILLDGARFSGIALPILLAFIGSVIITTFTVRMLVAASAHSWKLETSSEKRHAGPAGK